MSLDAFWAAVDAQLEELKTAQTADDVLRILANERDPYYTLLGDTETHGPGHGRDGFFAGGGGDGSVWGSLREAGWHTVWSEAGYHWCMRSPCGDAITYVEGDIYRGDSRPQPKEQPNAATESTERNHP